MNKYFQLAIQAHMNGDFVKAHDLYNQALRINPTSVETLINLGSIYIAFNDYDKAEMFFKNALQISPNETIYQLLGNLYCEQNKLNDSLICFSKSLKINPKNSKSYSGLGKVFLKLNKIKESIDAYETAIKLDPNDHLAKTDYCYPLLIDGQFIKGWKMHESRFDAKVYGPHYGQGWNRWEGQSLIGKSILIFPESGFGDTIQFARYVPLIKEFGGYVIMGCRPELFELFKNIKNVDLLTMDSYQTDYQISMMSLPYAFKTTLESIPNNMPYIHVEKKPIDIIQNQPGLKVGLVWGGNTFKDNPSFALMNKRRSIKLKQFAPLSKIEGVSLFSLQMPDNEASEQLKDVPFKITPVMDDVRDFNDTANIIMNLDLLISVDTSIVHLAGAINKPVWMVSRFDTCWRWMKDRSDSPWYPSMKIFRQPKQGDWDSVINEVTKELNKLTKGN